jgi:GTP-binding protein HflX
MSEEKNKAILVAVCLDSESYQAHESSINELERLADTAGFEVVGKFIQNRHKYEAATYAGKGFLENMRQVAEEKNAQFIIFDDELSPSQAKNVSDTYELMVIDRTELILDIFSLHAKTREARLQIRLSLLQYQLPRLKKLWSHLDRVRGSSNKAAGAASRGMGEKQIEVDKRKIRIEIAQVKKELEKVMRQTKTKRKKRELFKSICLVGYTNVGKSMLFRTITNEAVLIKDQLFATLDSTSRKVDIEAGEPAILTDTVGFIANLPHHLIASFRATLKEVVEADLLLHIADSSDEKLGEHIANVEKVLSDIGAGEVERKLVLNKIDLLDDEELDRLKKDYPHAIFISALQKINIESMLEKIRTLVFDLEECKLFVPHTKQKVLHRIYDHSQIISSQHTNEGTEIIANLDKERQNMFADFIVGKK